MKLISFKNSSFILYITLIVFFLDSLINYFISFPVQILLLPLFVMYMLISYKSVYTYCLLLCVFLLVIFGSRYTFTSYDVGYFIYLAFLIVSFVYLKGCVGKGSIYGNLFVVRFLFITSSIFFWSYLLGFDNQVHDVDMSAEGANIEYYRQYHSGLFRAPHFPSYIFYFLSLVVIYFKRDFPKFEWCFMLLFCIISVLVSGTRTPIYAFLLASLFVLITRNYKYFLSACLMVFVFILLYYNIDFFLNEAKGTVFYQYLSFVHTIKYEPERLSRFQLFSAFYQGLDSFNIVDFILGKSFSYQYDIVNRYLGQKLWFHNDFLSLFYSYGVMFSLWLIYYVCRYYINHVHPINNYILSVYFLSLVFFSIFNGIIYHPTYLIFYLFFMMVSYERERKGFNT